MGGVTGTAEQPLKQGRLGCHFLEQAARSRGLIKQERAHLWDLSSRKMALKPKMEAGWRMVPPVVKLRGFSGTYSAPYLAVLETQPLDPTLTPVRRNGGHVIIVTQQAVTSRSVRHPSPRLLDDII